MRVIEKCAIACAAVLWSAIVLLAPPPAWAALGDCGQPVSNGTKPTASDCLYVLKAGLGTVTCDCVCDTDGSGTVVASDALRCLKVAVGQPLDLACTCSGSTTTSTTSTTSTSPTTSLTATTSTTLPPVHGFQLATPEVEIQPGEEITYCYYFRTPNAETMAIKRWASELRPGTAQMIVFLTVDENGSPIDKQPPGTLSTAGCDMGGSTLPQWMYAAQSVSAELAFPSDDGTGKPVAAEIPPGSAGFILMHNLNPTEAVIPGGVTVEAEALTDGLGFTESATFVTYNGNIAIPPQSTNYEVSQSCTVPSDVRFWWMSTHTHSHAIHTAILDSTTTVFEGTNWANPGAQIWASDPFFTFNSGALTHRCTYDNPTGQTILSGDSYVSNEQCMAITYFFPASRPLWCVNGVGPF